MNENAESIGTRKISDSFEYLPKKQKDYKHAHYFWASVHFLLGTVSIVFATAVATKYSFAPAISDKTVEFLVPLLTGILTFLTPGARAGKYKAARLILKLARINFELKGGPNDEPPKALETASKIVMGAE